MTKRFKVNHIVRIARDNDNEAYSRFRGQKLRIVSWATKYMPAREFFAQGKPDGYHPGFDGAAGCALYDLETLNGDPVPFSLYDYELEDA